MPSEYDRRGENGEFMIDADIQAGIARILQGTAEDHGCLRPTWTLESLREVIARDLGTLVPVRHHGEVLHNMGGSLGQPKPSASLRMLPVAGFQALVEDPAVQATRRLDGAGQLRAFMDKMDIHLKPRTGRDETKVPRSAAVVETAGQNVKRYTARRIDPRPNRMTYVSEDRKASTPFLDLLLLSRACTDERGSST